MAGRRTGRREGLGSEGPRRRRAALPSAPSAGPFSPAVPPSVFRGKRSRNRGRPSRVGGKSPGSPGKPPRNPGKPSRSPGSRSGKTGNLPGNAGSRSGKTGKRPGNAGSLPRNRGKPSGRPGKLSGIGGNSLALWGKPLRSADFCASSSQPCEPGAQDSSSPFPPHGNRPSPPSLDPVKSNTGARASRGISRAGAKIYVVPQRDLPP